MYYRRGKKAVTNVVRGGEKKSRTFLSRPWRREKSPRAKRPMTSSGKDSQPACGGEEGRERPRMGGASRENSHERAGAVNSLAEKKVCFYSSEGTMARL